ncbi:MAG: hypothetical protein ACTS6G_04570 [Candidatus Hodgkinia cicadicola]
MRRQFENVSHKTENGTNVERFFFNRSEQRFVSGRLSGRESYQTAVLTFA